MQKEARVLLGIDGFGEEIFNFEICSKYYLFALIILPEV
jgi:hypothetical protein